MDKDEQRLKMIGASIKRKREESGYSQKLVADNVGLMNCLLVSVLHQMTKQSTLHRFYMV